MKRSWLLFHLMMISDDYDCITLSLLSHNKYTNSNTTQKQMLKYTNTNLYTHIWMKRSWLLFQLMMISDGCDCITDTLITLQVHKLKYNTNINAQIYKYTNTNLYSQIWMKGAWLLFHLMMISDGCDCITKSPSDFYHVTVLLNK